MQHDHEMKECIELCWQCRTECEQTLFRHCVEEGGEHVAPDHIRLMADCIQICQAAADFMTRNSDLHESVCEVCAEVCDECAESCEDIDSEEMKNCADLCRRCADSCREMAGVVQASSLSEKTGANLYY